MPTQADEQMKSDEKGDPEVSLSEKEIAWLNAQHRKNYPTQLMKELGEWHAQMADFARQSKDRWDGKVSIGGVEVDALQEHERLKTQVDRIRRMLAGFRRFTYEEREFDASESHGTKGVGSAESSGTLGDKSSRTNTPTVLPDLPHLPEDFPWRWDSLDQTSNKNSAGRIPQGDSIDSSASAEQPRPSGEAL
ncbi:hypothetical protein NCC49_001667 [Naganishia albida]|nr:hypothetical protein NCC49_001667 [Naganishia albida]